MFYLFHGFLLFHPFAVCSHHFELCAVMGGMKLGKRPQIWQNFSKGQRDDGLFWKSNGAFSQGKDKLMGFSGKLSIWLRKIFAVAAGACQHYIVP